MIIDNELLFADGTWAPTATGDNFSPNVLDCGPLTLGAGTGGGSNLGRDLGQGEAMWLVVTVIQTVTSGGAATVEFRLVSAANAALSTTPITIITSGLIPKATLVQASSGVAGYTFMAPLPSFPVGTSGYQRFLGVNANIGTAVLTAGKFHATILHDKQKNQKYVSSFGLDS